MGHDIYALKNYPKWQESYENEEEDLTYDERSRKYVVAYLRFGMGDRNANLFYNALSCEDFNHNVSGSGHCVWIDKEKILEAIDKLLGNDDEDIQYFLNKVLSYMNKNQLNHIEITFQ